MEQEFKAPNPRRPSLRISLQMVCAVASSLLLASTVMAQRDFSNVSIKTTDLGNGIYMMTGAGGNLGVSAGEDGVFLVDDQFAPLTEKIRAAIGKVSQEPIRFVINTHWHGDHTGGNENLGSSGSVIVAHDNVRERMSTEQFIKHFGRQVPPSPKAALPVITYDDSLTFHLNGQTIHAFHVPPAHTDGDSVVHFKEGNVVHMGDLFFNGGYPFIDTSSGGNIDGVIAAGKRVLALADAKTQIIPGHGPLADKKTLESYVKMLETVHDGIRPLVDAGKTRDEVVAAAPTSALDEVWGQGFIKPADFAGIVYDGMKQ